MDYLELLCKDEQKKEEVVEFLQGHQEKLSSYIDVILEMVKQYDIPEANSFLLERKDEVDKAIDSILKEIKDKLIADLEKKLVDAALRMDPDNTKFVNIKRSEKFNKLVSAQTAFETYDEAEGYQSEQDPERRAKLLLQSKNYEYDLPLFEGVEVEDSADCLKIGDRLRIAIKMCERNTVRKTMDEDAVNKLWSKLLDAFFGPYRMKKFEYYTMGPVKKQDVFQQMESELAREAEDDEFEREELENALQEISKITQKMAEMKTTGKNATLLKTEEKKLQTQQNLAATLNKSVREREERRKKLEAETNVVEEAPTHKLVNLWLQRVYFTYVLVIIRKMISILPIPTILEKIMSDLKDDKFVNYRGLIMRLHNRYKHDRGLSDTANSILKSDNFELGKSFKKAKAKAMNPESEKCSHPKCQKDLRDEEKKIRIFDCHHAFHFTSCLNENENIHYCINCHQKVVPKSSQKTVDEKHLQSGSHSSTEEELINIKTMDSILDSKSNSKIDVYENLVDGTKKNASLKFSDGLKLYPTPEEEIRFGRKKDSIKTTADFINHYQIGLASIKTSAFFVQQTSYDKNRDGSTLWGYFNKLQSN